MSSEAANIPLSQNSAEAPPKSGMPLKKIRLSTTPHVHSTWSTAKVMWMVVFSLVPCAVLAVVFFGFFQIAVMAVSILTALGAEYAMKLLRKKKATLMDGSTVITGLLFALILPPNFNLFFTFIGSAFSICIGKELFGGLGYNIFNPALVGRAFLQAAFPTQMTTWSNNMLMNTVDAVTKPTPLAVAKFGDEAAKQGIDLGGLFFGNINGSMGETSAIAIFAGGIFLIVLGIVNWRIPVSMIVTVLLFGGIFHFANPAYPQPLFHLLAGGFLFGTFFMATDWVTSPLTNAGMWIYGFFISIIIVIIRLFGGLPEGVMYAILIMNGFTPLINRGTRPKIFGEKA